jgi:hypothetical protein
MAKFGQSFIQSLTQPGYSQGMFDLGSTLGQAPAVAAEKREREGMLAQIKDMTPLETADLMVDKAKTPEQLVAAKTAKASALKTSGVQSIDVMQQQLLTETDPVRMQELENAMVAVGKQTGNDVSKYSGIAGKTLAARDTAAWEQTQRDNEKKAVVETRMVDFAVNGMMATGSTEIPTTLNTPQGEVPIPENLRDDIQAEYARRAKAEADFQASIDGGKLPAEYAAFINDNQQLFKDNAALQSQVRIIKETEGKGPSAARTNAIKSLRTLVDAEQAKRREASTSDTALEMDVNALIEEIITSEDRTYWWEGDDMQDFLTGDGSDEELKLFRSQAVQYLKENPKASKQQVIDAGMTGMKRKVPAQGKSDAREAKAAEERQRMDTIGKQIRAAYPDQNFSDAQIEALVARELERIAVSEYNADDKLRTRTMR